MGAQKAKKTVRGGWRQQRGQRQEEPAGQVHTQLVVQTIRSAVWASVAPSKWRPGRWQWFDHHKRRTYLKYSMQVLVQDDGCCRSMARVPKTPSSSTSRSWRPVRVRPSPPQAADKPKKPEAPPPGPAKGSAADKRDPKAVLPRTKAAAVLAGSETVKKVAKPSAPKGPKRASVHLRRASYVKAGWAAGSPPLPQAAAASPPLLHAVWEDF
ncbi:histone H1.10-like [Marmota marmota marmota]|uniref:histone H1.10-like n=1 Tax=Marmota marmota marmota TaxID=9994 RepID=UPI0007624195|nr:histone H1.10-like [Marmota marmota marmota]